MLAEADLLSRQSKVRVSFGSILVDEGLTDFLPIFLRACGCVLAAAALRSIPPDLYWALQNFI